ncbi:MAG TPA: DUF459 domain-containing protein [Ilumatobacteraceae bacterium]|nr:DUF459 domain-containing protein [Ilumatobacteraceae bacterium]
MSLAAPPSRPTPRQPVSRHRYRVRRLAALTLLVAVGAGAAKVVSTLGDDGGPIDTGTDVVDASDSSVAPVETSGGDGIVAPDESAATTPPTEPPPDDTGPPTAENPAVVLIAGDSDAGTFAPYLDRLLGDTDLVDTTLDYKVSSGLARPDYFDWNARLHDQVPAVDPDIVVITFGGNDAQGLLDATGDVVAFQPVPDSDNADWRAEYGKRVGEVMDFVVEGGRTVIWVGIPNDDDPDVTFRMQVQDETAKAEAAKRPSIVFIDTWSRFSGRTGGWAEYVIDPRDGTGKDVRADDGFHLNEAGAEILALDIAEAIKADLRARGADI